ncbi:MAG: hypothetical protein K2P92_04600 [Bdellovibrionaceae bacterium]|nr:hypothetical protein [Pseudobdellovibrionaceae bacterium]
MKIFFLVFLFLNITASAYPSIVAWQNSPVVAFENKHQAELKANGLLKSPFAVVTDVHDEMTLKLNGFDRVLVYEKSKAQILEIMNEGLYVPDFYLIDGRLRVTSEFRGVDKSDQNMTLKTPFLDLKLASEADFFIELNMKEAWIELKVMKGSIPLEFFAYEKKITLMEGQSVRFQGELSDDKKSIRYDYLLNNRKAPRGELQTVKSFDREKFLKEDDRLRQAEVARKKQIEKQRLDKIRKQKAYEDSFLCKKPFGQKDQCAWWLEKGKCYRKRCNVSGQWGDVIERPVTARCQPGFTVSICDY